MGPNRVIQWADSLAPAACGLAAAGQGCKAASSWGRDGAQGANAAQARRTMRRQSVALEAEVLRGTAAEGTAARGGAAPPLPGRSMAAGAAAVAAALGWLLPMAS